MGLKEIILIVVMTLIFRLFKNRRKDSFPVNNDRRKGQKMKRAKESFEWHMDAIREQTRSAEELLRK